MMRQLFSILFLCVIFQVYGQYKAELQVAACFNNKSGINTYYKQINDTMVFILPNSLPDTAILTCLSQEYLQLSEMVYREKRKFDLTFTLLNPLKDKKYTNTFLGPDLNEKKLKIKYYREIEDFEDTLYFTSTEWYRYSFRTIAIVKREDTNFIFNRDPYFRPKSTNFLTNENRVAYYQLHYDTLKLTFSDFESVHFEEGCFDGMELDTIPFSPNDTINYSIDKYDYDLHTSAYKDARRQYHYMPPSILKFINAKTMYFAKHLGNIGYDELNMWIPKEFYKLDKLLHFYHNIFIPEREKKRILKNKNLEYLSYFYPPEQDKFEKKLPEEVFEMDSLRSIYISGDVKNILKLRKMKSLEEIGIYKYINPINKTYDTTTFEFVLSDEDRKWMKQHKKLYKLHKDGLLNIGGFGENKFGQLEDVWYYGFSKLYHAPVKKIPFFTMVLNPYNTKYLEYHGKRFFVSDSIKTLKLEIFGMNEWQNPNLSAKWYRNYFIFHQNVRNMSDSDRQEIIDRYYFADVKRAEDNSLQNIKFTFRELPKQIRHLDDVEQITMKGYDYDFPFVFSKYFLRMKSLKEIKLLVGGYTEGSEFDEIMTKLNDKYDNEDFSKFQGIDEKEHDIIRKLRKKGVKVYYEKQYN